MSEWISVRERYPEEGEYVLGLNSFNGMDRSHQHVVMYEADAEWPWFNEDSRWMLNAFSHWVPLPAPPETV